MPPSPEQRAALFTAADKNSDGRLDKSEWLATLPDAMKSQANVIWPRVDKAGLGFVSKEAFVEVGRTPGEAASQ